MNQCSLNVRPSLMTKRFSDSMLDVDGFTRMYCPVRLRIVFRWNRYSGNPNPALMLYSDGPSHCGRFK